MSSTAHGSNFWPTLGMNSSDVPSYCASVLQSSMSSSLDA